MDVAIVASRPTQPSYRFRVEPFLPRLAERGIRCRVVFWPRTLWGRLTVWPRLAGADVVWVQRRLLSPWELAVLRRLAPRLVYDFDDAVFLRDDGRPSPRRSSRFVRLVQAADLVVCGNTHLARPARRFCRRVVVVPTVVDTRRFVPADGGVPASGLSECEPSKSEPDGVGVSHDVQPVRASASSVLWVAGGRSRRLEVVWTGSRSTNRYLADLLPVLGRLRGRVRLTVVSDSREGLQDAELWGAALRFVPWSPHTEVQTLQQADVGVMPLPDDPWTRGKCGLKLLQYMAVGLAVVASPVGVNVEIVEHERTGLLARTLEEWSAALLRLAADESLRRRLAAAARRHVEQHYSVDVYAPRLAELLQSLVARSNTAGELSDDAGASGGSLDTGCGVELPAGSKNDAPPPSVRVA